ncbi:MAG: 3'-5' exonuclease domain-containing protein 2 [Bacteroidales bacterium]|nr:3'-5' exonuclease domain-containing protein 2 [Bacteroidales bacterium]
MRYPAHIDREAIMKLPMCSFRGEIELIEPLQDCRAAVDEISKFSVVGFDTETKPVFKRGVQNKISLVQFSTGRKAWLFRLKNAQIPLPLKQLLKESTIEKVGVSVQDDIHALGSCCSGGNYGFVDLQNMVNQYGIEELSLRKMAAIVLNIRISKSQQLSDWNAPVLSEAQIRYAATDAWMALMIYQKLTNGSTFPNELCRK